jgi:hypothetical protein
VDSLADAAYNFAAESPAVSTVLSGTASTAHLTANAAAIVGPRLPPSTSQRLRDIFIPAGRSVLLHRFRRRDRVAPDGQAVPRSNASTSARGA